MPPRACPDHMRSGARSERPVMCRWPTMSAPKPRCSTDKDLAIPHLEADLPVSAKLARTLVYAAIRFDKWVRPCPKGFVFRAYREASDHSGLGVHNLGIGRTEDHDCERLGLHLYCPGLKAKGRSRKSLPRNSRRPDRVTSAKTASK